MSDLISRKWLMECVDEGWIKFDTEKDKNIYVHLVRDIAPSAQPERKTGEWITHYYKLGTERYECNVCHNRIGDTPYYCPNCGADMRGEQDE